MKILAVVLSLAIAIGPEAWLVRANHYPSTPKMQVIINELSGLVIDGYVKVTKKLELVRRSKAGKAVSDEFEKLIEPLQNLDRPSAVPAELSGALDLVSEVLWGMTSKAGRIFQDVERHYSSANLEHVAETLSAYVDPTLVKVCSYAEPLLIPLAEKVNELDEELNERITQAMESLDGQLSFYVKRLEEIREGLQPLTEEAEKQYKLGLETLNKNLKPYLDRLLEERKKYSDSFKEWVNAPLYPPEES